MKNLLDVATMPARTAFKAAGWAGKQLRGGGSEPAPRPAPTPPQRSQRPKELDDVTIARKVESILFRAEDRPKQDVDVNVVDGVVYLRGEVKTPQLINELEAEAKQIPEVKGVENLLHLPKTPSPTRADSPPAQRKTRSKKSAPAKPRKEPRGLNADKTVAKGETLPEDLAEQGKGRQTAPLGSNDDA